MLIYLLMISSLIFSAEKSYVDPAAKKEMAAKNDELIQKVLADKDVQPVYEDCKKNPTNGEDLSTCLFNKLQSTGKFDEIKNKYLKGTKDGVKSDHNTTLIETRATKDPAILKLEEYLMKRLQEALYGDISSEAQKRGKVVDHETFYRLYQTQLSKNVISTLSAYMIDSDGPPGCEYNDGARENNLRKLKDAPEATSASWQDCIGKIPKLCKTGKNEAKNRACLVTRELKDLRQNLLYSTAVIDQIEKNKVAGADRGTGVDIYHSSQAPEGKTVDDLTSLTSGELERSGFAAENEVMEKELKEKCVANAEDPVCKQYLHSDDEKKKLEELSAEAELRGKMVAENFTNMSDENFKKYLLEEGRTTEEVEKIMNDKKAMAQIKDSIQKQYDAEKDALIKKMKDRMGVRSSPATKDNPTAKPDISKISKEIADRTKNYAQLVQFNNIVSGYLKVGDDSSDNAATAKPAEQNIAAVKRELRDSAKDEKFGATIADDQKSAIEGTIQGKTQAKGDSMNIKVEDINKVLNYQPSNP